MEVVDLCSDVESGSETVTCMVCIPRFIGLTLLLSQAHSDAYIEESRQIRKEQDEAYQQSSEADKAKDKAKAEKEQAEKVFQCLYNKHE